MFYQKICEHCGKQFTAQKSTTRFCSKYCADAAYKEKLRRMNQSLFSTAPDATGKGQKEVTRDIMSPRLLAEYLGVDIRTVYRYLADNIIPSIKLRGKTLVRKSDVDKLFDSAPPYQKRTVSTKAVPEKGTAQGSQGSTGAQPADRGYTTVREVAEKYGLSPAGTDKLLKESGITVVRHRGKHYYPLSEVEALFRRREAASHPEITEWYTGAEVQEKYGSTAVYQTLNDNNGCGLIFETEGDTLSANFNTDYGNFSDGFRKAFHHEPISYLRRKDREYVKIDRPKLSALLAGTPRQVANLIHDSENGLFSRFVFYYMISKLEWHDVFERVNDTGMEDYFKKLGRDIKVLYEHLEASPRTLRFRLTDRQETDFNKTLSALLNQYAADYGPGIAPSVKRLGLVMFRIAMCLSALRLTEDGNFVDDIVCLDQDYETAMAILSVLIEHTVVIYEQLPANSSLHGKGNRTSNRLTNLFNALPDEFDKATFKAVAEKMNLNPRSMDRNLSKWRDAGLVQDVSRGRYRKVNKALITPQRASSPPSARRESDIPPGPPIHPAGAPRRNVGTD